MNDQNLLPACMCPEHCALLAQFPEHHLSPVLEILYIDHGINFKPIPISLSTIRREWQFSLTNSIPAKVTQEDLNQSLVSWKDLLKTGGA